ncbi:multidrug ABC transporter ATP-binding protein [Latilactobacillus sakei]|uniref:ABC transporter ATP-binding protein n=1 Tax=Latilactobacillus sakei TaxID=1599 RepID=UPI00220C8906|nr:multidrug ABC transporter ATP-binding protein [Latilactobacillus sakei]
MTVVAVQQVSKVYGHRFNLVNALNNISFEIEEGEFVGIMGPSGAGKTTLLNMIATIDRPTHGQVMIKNQVVTKMREAKLANFRRHDLGFIFQDFNLLDSLTVRENILLPLALDKMSVALIEKRLAQVTQVLGIGGLLDRYPDEISIGQRQRVACGRAMITNPTLLLADEPTGSLDSKSATELLRYLTEINHREKTTILLVTHDAFTASYCRRILFIKDGQLFSEIVRSGDRQQFFNQIIDMQATIGGGGRYNAVTTPR